MQRLFQQNIRQVCKEQQSENVSILCFGPLIIRLSYDKQIGKNMYRLERFKTMYKKKQK